jgi:hypothetical protein
MISNDFYDLCDWTMNHINHKNRNSDKKIKKNTYICIQININCDYANQNISTQPIRS